MNSKDGSALAGPFRDSGAEPPATPAEYRIPKLAPAMVNPTKHVCMRCDREPPPGTYPLGSPCPHCGNTLILKEVNR